MRAGMQAWAEFLHFRDRSIDGQRLSWRFMYACMPGCGLPNHSTQNARQCSSSSTEPLRYHAQAAKHTGERQSHSTACVLASIMCRDALCGGVQASTPLTTRATSCRAARACWAWSTRRRAAPSRSSTMAAWWGSRSCPPASTRSATSTALAGTSSSGAAASCWRSSRGRRCGRAHAHVHAVGGGNQPRRDASGITQTPQRSPAGHGPCYCFMRAPCPSTWLRPIRPAPVSRLSVSVLDTRCAVCGAAGACGRGRHGRVQGY